MRVLNFSQAAAPLLCALAVDASLAADAEHGKAHYQASAACHGERPDALGPSLKGVVACKSAALADDIIAYLEVLK